MGSRAAPCAPTILFRCLIWSVWEQQAPSFLSQNFRAKRMDNKMKTKPKTKHNCISTDHSMDSSSPARGDDVVKIQLSHHHHKVLFCFSHFRNCIEGLWIRQSLISYHRIQKSFRQSFFSLKRKRHLSPSRTCIGEPHASITTLSTSWTVAHE